MHEQLSDNEFQYIEDLRDQYGDDYANRAHTEILNLRASFNAMLESEQGLNVLWWMVSNCKIFATGVDEARRAVGLELLEQIMLANPNAWIKLQQDNIKDMTKQLATEL